MRSTKDGFAEQPPDGAHRREPFVILMFRASMAAALEAEACPAI